MIPIVPLALSNEVRLTIPLVFHILYINFGPFLEKITAANSSILDLSFSVL